MISLSWGITHVKQISVLQELLWLEGKDGLLEKNLLGSRGFEHEYDPLKRPCQSSALKQSQNSASAVLIATTDTFRAIVARVASLKIGLICSNQAKYTALSVENRPEYDIFLEERVFFFQVVMV